MPLKTRQALPLVNLFGMLACVILSAVSPVFLAWPLGYGVALTICSLYAMLDLKSVAGLWAGPALFAIHTYWAGGFLYGMLAPVAARLKGRRASRRVTDTRT